MNLNLEVILSKEAILKLIEDNKGFYNPKDSDRIFVLKPERVYIKEGDNYRYIRCVKYVGNNPKQT